jgi:hypothetical protein
MKIDIEKIVFTETRNTKKRTKIDLYNDDTNTTSDKNFKQIYHDGKVLQFWTPKMLMPFGIDNEYGKYMLKLEFDDDKNEEHAYFKKVILHIEKLIKKKLEIENDSVQWKSIIKKRENKSDILELRIKNIKNNIQTEILNNNDNIDIENSKENDNYLKTIFDLKKQTYIKALIEINGLWDYRINNIDQNKVGLICYAAKLYI